MCREMRTIIHQYYWFQVWISWNGLKSRCCCCFTDRLGLEHWSEFYRYGICLESFMLLSISTNMYSIRIILSMNSLEFKISYNIIEFRSTYLVNYYPLGNIKNSRDKSFELPIWCTYPNYMGDDPLMNLSHDFLLFGLY